LKADQIAKKSIVEKYGQQFDQWFHDVNHGDEDIVYWTKLIQKHQLSIDPQVLTAESSQLYSSYAQHYNKLYPHTQDLLERCKTNEVTIGICTNSHKERTLQSLSSFAMESDFDYLVTRNDIAYWKPSPEWYILLAKKMNILLDDTCVIVENSPTWLAAAIQTESTVVQIDHAKNQQKIAEAHHYITNRSELLSIFS
jgi:HAD superfamily hydrolase (TIGR01509 family)